MNRLLNTRGLTGERRAELEAERDRLAPVLQPPTREDLERLIERVEAKQASGSSLPDGSPAGESILQPGTPDSSVDAAMLARARKLDVAKQGIDALLKLKKLHIDDSVTAVAEQRARFSYEMWSGRADWETLSTDEKAPIIVCQLRAWRRAPVFERPTWEQAAWFYFIGLPAVEKLRPYSAAKKLTPEQRKDIFKRLNIAEKMKQPVPERYLDEVPLSEAESTDTEPVLSAPALEPSPAVRTIDDRVNLILQIDPNLARLAAYAPEYDSGIRAAITRQLQEHGYADGSFLAGLYNASRPKNLSAFPPRTF